MGGWDDSKVPSLYPCASSFESEPSDLDQSCLVSIPAMQLRDDPIVTDLSRDLIDLTIIYRNRSR